MRTPLFTLTLALAGLAGCDAAPNPNFETAYKEQEKQRSGDPFVALTGDTGFGNWMQSEGSQKASYLGYYGGRTKSAVETGLGTLDGLPAPAEGQATVTACKQALRDALAPDVATQAAATQAALTTCRTQAKALEGAAEGPDKVYFNGLKRTASSAMAVVAMAVVSAGDTDAGIAQWRAADQAAREDRPAFRIRPEQFRRNY
ncbi:hypothetical protein BZG35_08395 [Brevundimonas sp. LM2]|uniref:hypothetical protein n=1 Tax=Brevundimonas sp. LM2 TaxID=1938605 RepID=UPI000983E575|nr:hypothetical protein [Brevundimonas sp. LM2]AQR61668.1 hypothetical protein BZG35_08395 [Brevundimonas sp. LM2]